MSLVFASPPVQLRRGLLIVLFAALSLGLSACKVDRIEVGSRVDTARESGALPASKPVQSVASIQSPESLAAHLLDAAQRNLERESVLSILETMDLPPPLQSDLADFTMTLEPASLKDGTLPLRLVAFLAERHDPQGRLQRATEAELTQLGLALSLDDKELLADLLVDKQESRLLHCASSDAPDLMLTAYAASLRAELERQGFRCRPVGLRN